MPDKRTEVQVTIDLLKHTRTADSVTVEANDVRVSATGPDSYAVASAVRSQLEVLFVADDEPDDIPDEPDHPADEPDDPPVKPGDDPQP